MYRIASKVALVFSVCLLGISSLPTMVNADSNNSNIVMKKVKPFKVSIVKSGYKIYNDANKKVSTTKKKFHYEYLVKKEFKKDDKKYYQLTDSKKHAVIGYVNKKAVAGTNQTVMLNNVKYVSQYKPVFAPWGCASASMAMLLSSKGKTVDLKYAQDHLPMVPTKGGQKGNVFTGAGFGHVIQPGALTKYARHWDKKVYNISGATTNDIKKYIQGGHCVIFYGYSSYQKPGDNVRNHIKTITGYKNHQFRVYDPLYSNSSKPAGSGGKNMKYDHGAISWESFAQFKQEYGKKALTIK